MTSIGISGYRYGPVSIEQAEALKKAVEAAPCGITFHQGCCIGIDEYVAKLAFGSHRVVAHPPIDERATFKNWREYCSEIREPLDYLDRNKAIVDSTTELWLGPNSLTETLRSGTWSTYRYARRRRVPIRIFWPDGKDEYAH